MGRCVPDGPQADHLDPRGVRAAHLKDQNRPLNCHKEAADFEKICGFFHVRTLMGENFCGYSEARAWAM